MPITLPPHPQADVPAHISQTELRILKELRSEPQAFTRALQSVHNDDPLDHVDREIIAIMLDLIHQQAREVGTACACVLHEG